MGQITLQGVRKSFGAGNIIKDANLDIEDGAFVVFVGPSGCGKTTLLRLIAPLEDGTGGQILIDGRNVVDVPPAKRGLSMVFQSYALYPHMSVRGNIGFGLKMAGLPRDETERRVEAAAATLNLTPYLDRKPRELSGGQRQRVAIGRAIVREPKAFLFDEPLSNLAAAGHPPPSTIELRTRRGALAASAPSPPPAGEAVLVPPHCDGLHGLRLV